MLLFTLILFLSFTVSCSGNRSDRDILIQIDSLTYHNPDSAILCLTELSHTINNYSLDIQKYYQLLTIKANDKAFIRHTSDSLILSIILYYEKTNNTYLLPEAYYYAGRVYADLYDAPKALFFYQKATNMLEKSGNYKLLKVIYSQIGLLLLYQDIYDEAMAAFKQAYHFNSILKDKKGQAKNLCSIGETFTGYGNADSALHYYKKANTKAKQINDINLVNGIQLHLATLYNQLEEYDSVKIILDNYNSPPNTNYYIAIADMYYGTHRLDSAIYYYNKVVAEKEMYTSQRAHFQLAEIAMVRNDANAVLEHTRKYKEWTTKITQATNTETIHKMHSYYNYQLREKENNDLRLKNVHQEKWIIVCCSTILLLGCLIAAYYQYNKRKRNTLNVQLEKLRQLKEEQYQSSTRFIEENERKIEALELQLKQSHKESDDMQKLLLTQKEQIRQMNERIKTNKEERQLSESLFRESDIYNKFHNAACNETIRISSDDWEMLRIKIDECYKGFSSRLRSIHPISNMEMRICLLLKININVTGISMLCGRSKSAIVSARKRLYEKYFAEKGKPEQWDEFILSL